MLILSRHSTCEKLLRKQQKWRKIANTKRIGGILAMQLTKKFKHRGCKEERRDIGMKIKKRQRIMRI